MAIRTTMEQLRHFINAEITFRVKHAILAFFLAAFSTVSVIHVNNVQAYNRCVIRYDNRNDLRSSLLFIVDLHDILPDDKGALSYTITRTNYINETYPTLPVCKKGWI